MFFLGAGFSCTAGLPNTAQLLTEVHALADTKQSWGVSKRIGDRLRESYRYFYPEKADGFRPDVVDFFSVLSSYVQMDRGGLPEGFPDRPLLADLRFAIVHVLCEAQKRATVEALARAHPLLDQMVRPGAVVITSNWDTLVERACEARGIPYRLWGKPDDRALLLLKLHGSIDWVLRKNAKRTPVTKREYAALQDLLNSSRARRRNLTNLDVLRVRIDRAGATWQTIKGSSSDPLMITMTPGKADSIGPLLDLWEHAYRAVSSARTLEIIGYSMPEDDIEIRTLLRAGVKRGHDDPDVTVRNPAPDVHVRVRELIHREAASDYTPVASIL